MVTKEMRVGCKFNTGHSSSPCIITVRVNSVSSLRFHRNFSSIERFAVVLYACWIRHRRMSAERMSVQSREQISYVRSLRWVLCPALHHQSPCDVVETAVASDRLRRSFGHLIVCQLCYQSLVVDHPRIRHFSCQNLKEHALSVK